MIPEIQKEIDAVQVALATEIDNLKWIADNRPMRKAYAKEIEAEAVKINKLRQRLIELYRYIEEKK